MIWLANKDEYDAAFERLCRGKGSPQDVALARRMSGLAGGEGTREGREANNALRKQVELGGKLDE